MKCVIVAAGQGARLHDVELKPLVPLLGMALIEHVITRAHAAGIADFVVVSGFRGGELRARLDVFAARDGVRVQHVVNDEWHRANGVSLWKARPLLGEPFVLTMCDHVVDPAILRALIEATPPADGAVLAVDRHLDNPLVDLDDVTRVQSRDGRIERIGKLLPDYDCFDTGVFLCTPGIFDALQASQAAGEDSITAAMNVLARQGRAGVLDIGGRLWIDVDDLASLGKATALMRSGRL